MDYFNNVITTFLGLERDSSLAVYAGSESFQISSKISKGLGLERHECEWLMTEFSFLGELSL